MTLAELMGYLTVLAGGATPWLEAVVVIPAGILAGLAVVPVTLLAVVGNLVTVALAGLGGERLRRWWTRRRTRRRRVPASTAPGEGDGFPRAAGPAEPPRTSRAERVWRRYGLPGLAVLGPIVIGTQVAALAAVTAGAPRRAVIAWVSLGTVGWSVAAAAATAAGMDLFA